MQDILAICDPGKALDDEEMLILACHLQKKGLLNLKAVICNLRPQIYRAQLAKGTLKLLGRPDIPVGAGSKVVSLPVQDEEALKQISHLAPDFQIEEGSSLFKQTLTNSKDNSICLLLCSALSDAAEFLLAEEKLFCKKICQVVIMGGIKQSNGNPILDEDGHYQPDTAVNNHYDMRAARFFYKRLQELSLPTKIITRFASYKAKLSSQIYASLAQNRHPLARHLALSNQRFIEEFWKAVNSDPDDLAHENLPARWNKELFLKTFCNDRGKDRSSQDNINDLVVNSVMADPLALLSAIPKLSNTFFQPYIHTTNYSNFEIIGIDEKQHGLTAPEYLVQFLEQNFFEALSFNSLQIPDTTATIYTANPVNYIPAK